MAAFAEIAGEAIAEELAPLLGEDITSVVPFSSTSAISELESLENYLQAGAGAEEILANSVKPALAGLGIASTATVLGKRKRVTRRPIPVSGKKQKNMVQLVKVQHEVKSGKTSRKKRRYKTGKRTRLSRRRHRNAVTSFNSYTGPTVIAGSSRRGSKYSVVARTYLPYAVADAGGGTSGPGTINNDFLNLGTGYGGFGYFFKLSHFTNYTDFTNMYRFYKILWVKLIFYPETNTHISAKANEGVGNTTQAYALVDYTDGVVHRVGQAPSICYAPDQTTASGFSEFNVAMAHDNAKFHMFNDSRELSVWLVPTIKDKVGASNSSTGPARPQWISTAHPDEEHYGLRCLGEGFHTANHLRVTCTMKVAFKDLKH
jgi:hypothetical protein